ETGQVPTKEKIEEVFFLALVMYKAVLGTHYKRKEQKKQGQLAIFYLITHHPQPRVPCQAPVNPRFEHVVHVLGRWPLVETRAGIEATDKANSLRKAPTP